MDMPKKEQAAPPSMVQIALLDADGVYQGIGEIDESEVTQEHVMLPDGCDLPVGKYFWDDVNKTFMPILKAGV